MLAYLTIFLTFWATRVSASPQQIEVFEGANAITNSQTNPPIDFGDAFQGQPGPSITFTVTNAGGHTLQVFEIVVPTGYILNTNDTNLQALTNGTNATFSVQLDTSMAGTNSGDIVISNNDPNYTNGFSFGVTGIVITPIKLVSLSGSLSFGVVGIGSSANGELTISNLGNDTLTVSNIAFSSPAFSGTWSGSIAAGSSTNVMITFAPANATNYDGVLTVVSDATSGVTTFPISGFGANDSLVLTVLTNGFGAVSPDRTGAPLQARKKYSLTAVPKPGNVFSNWTGSITTNQNPLNFVMESNTILRANFVTNPFLKWRGTYNGLFSTSNEVTESTAGMLKNLIVSTKGSYSGALLINGASHSLSGSFDVAGQATNHLSRTLAQGGSLAVVMALSSNSNGVPQITGVVSNADWHSTNLLADFATNTLPPAEYTALLLPVTNNSPPFGAPGGDGYAAITNRSETATISGALADGTTINQTVPVSADGYAPIYANLYTNHGLLLGWINIVSNDANRVGLTWIRPGHATAPYAMGFTNVLSASQILISPWSNAPATLNLLTNLALLDSSLDTNATAVFPVNITNNGKIADQSVTGSINSKTGVFKVMISDGGTAVNGVGAILLNRTNGGGYFLTKTNAQAIELGN